MLKAKITKIDERLEDAVKRVNEVVKHYHDYKWATLISITELEETHKRLQRILNDRRNWECEEEISKK